MREKINVIHSRFVPMPQENIDTDQIIPARFLKRTTKEGFGENLFRDRRYSADGMPIADFPLNNPLYDGEILVAGKNFGCGSSREHAAWAIMGYGFRAVVSSFFADIFRNNALNCGLLPVVVSEKFLANAFRAVKDNPTAELTIDLSAQTITNNTTGESEHFEINAYKKECLMQGLDDVDYLLSQKDKILEYEKREGK